MKEELARREAARKRKEEEDRIAAEQAADNTLVEAIEAATEQSDAENYTCLTDDERAELVELVEAAVAHAASD